LELGTCIVSSDSNPLYIDFFPLVHRVWRELVGVRCVLALIADELPPPLESLKDDILLIPPLDGVHPGFHALCIRLLVPQLVGEQRAIIVSDIDMLPMDREYFRAPLRDAEDDAFVVYQRHKNWISFCYNAGTSETWRDLVGPVANVAQANAVIARWAAPLEGQLGWGTDETLLKEFVERFGARCVFLPQERLARLDRTDVGRRLSLIQRSLISRHHFSDYHMKRPYQEFETINAEIVDLLLSGSKRPRALDHRFYRMVLHRWARIV